MASSEASGEDTPGRHEDCGEACPSNERQLDGLTFLEGGVDAVTITEDDLEGLEPGRCLSNNMIDFYIKYLESRLSSQERDRFYFFNSFFFTKLSGSNSASTDIDDLEVDYKQLRKWSGEVDLFEKDFVFIPVLRSSHWSLIVICHLSGLTSNSPDNRKGSPCVFHLDPLKGTHESFELQVRRYIIQAWMDRHRDSTNSDQIILALACKMKYVQAKVPQQGNSYDCGLYLLHYVESFIHESTAADFSFDSSVPGPQFTTSAHFEEEISAKRTVIHKLIRELSNNPQERAPIGVDIEPNPQRGGSVAHSRNYGQPNPLVTSPTGRSKLNKKWSPEETSALLKRLVEGGRIRKGSEVPTHWNLISQDIQTKCGTIRSEDECRRRYDTLLKAYKKLKKTGKPYSDITGVERKELNLATLLSEEWYNAIDLQRRCEDGKPRKRAKIGPSSSVIQVAIPGFSSLDEDLRSTLLFLIQAVPMRIDIFSCPTSCDADYLCQWLAFVQDQKPSVISRFLFKLLELKLVTFKNSVSCVDRVPLLDLSKIRAHKKVLKEELCKYFKFDMYLQVCGKYDSASFPKSPLPLSMQHIRVLSLFECKHVEHADLSHFPELRSLSINRCGRLKEVTGWEDVKDLRWLSIFYCDSYVGFPSLRSDFDFRKSWVHEITPVRDVSQCVRLRRLDILRDKSLTSVDVSTLSILEILSLGFFHALTTIQGLSELHFLTKLILAGCEAMRRVPELGCLKALTHLNLRYSGVEDIAGVQELHLLTKLDLYFCRSLETLPCLRHLKALAYLDIGESGVEEIPGVEDLVSLEGLSCGGSRLKRLPDLHQLPQLRKVGVNDTPLSTVDPSSFYYGKKSIEYKSEKQVNPIVTLQNIIDQRMTQNPSI